MNNIVILGGEGTVGSAFRNHIKLDKKQCNITDICSIQEMVSFYNPSIIINCAGIVGTQKCENDKELTYLTNLGGVVNLIHICNKLKIKFVQISTIYTDSDNVYSHSKSMAEKVIMRTSNNYLIVALPWVFNYDDSSFISKALSGYVSIYDNEIGFLAYAPDVARYIEENIDLNGFISISNKGCLKRRDAIKELSVLTGINIECSNIDRTIPGGDICKAPSIYMRPWQEAMKEYVDGIRAMQSTS